LSSGFHTSGAIEIKGRFRRLLQLRVFSLLKQALEQIPDFLDIVWWVLLRRGRTIRAEALDSHGAVIIFFGVAEDVAVHTPRPRVFLVPEKMLNDPLSREGVD